jgi:hypothetical protein
MHHATDTMSPTPCYNRCHLLLAAVNGTVARVCDSAAPVVMQCPTGSIIAVSDAVYGRPADTSCPGPAGSCAVADVASMIRSRCDRQSSCVLTGDTFRTTDPCNMVLKELRVDYTCQGKLAYSGSSAPVHWAACCLTGVAVLDITATVLVTCWDFVTMHSKFHTAPLPSNTCIGILGPCTRVSPRIMYLAMCACICVLAADPNAACTTCCADAPTSPLDNGAWANCTKAANGQSCAGECFEGFTPVGSPSVKCVGGAWDAASLTGTCQAPSGGEFMTST